MGKMTVLFEDEFESGNFLAWDGTTSRPLAEIGVVTNPVFKGLYSSRNRCFPGDSPYAMCYYSLIPFAIYSPLYYRNYIQFNRLPSTVGEEFAFIDIYRTDNQDMLAAGLSFQGGLPQWWLRYRDGAGFTSIYSPTPTPIPNNWYCIEIMNIIHAVNGEAHLWVGTPGGGESEILSAIGINSASAVNSRVGSGIFYHAGADTTIYVDCCVAADARIGPEVGLGRLPQYQNVHAGL